MTRAAPRSVEQAETAARRAYPRSVGFQGAYVRGWLAGRRGRTDRACPYRRRTEAGWSNVWATTWRRGWLAGLRARDEAGEAS